MVYEIFDILLRIIGAITLFAIAWQLIFGGELNIKLYNPLRFLRKVNARHDDKTKEGKNDS